MGEGEVDEDSNAGCSSTAWTVRTVINLPNLDSSAVTDGRLDAWNTERIGFANLFFDIAAPWHVLESMHHEVTPSGSGHQITLNVLFKTEQNATDGAEKMLEYLANGPVQVFGEDLNEQDPQDDSVYLIKEGSVSWGPRVYSWVAQTTSNPLQIMPTGLDVDGVYFKSNCMSAGCWVVDVTYTTGQDNWNVFYIPKTDDETGAGPFYDALSFDHNYDSLDDNSKFPWSYYGATPYSTYLPSNFPCGSDSYVPGVEELRRPITACCIPEFLDMYRPVQGFKDWIEGRTESGVALDLTEASCDGGRSPYFARPFESASPASGKFSKPPSFLEGKFAGFTYSDVKPLGTIDPYLGIYRAQLQLDEIELRRFAGMIEGTVGVEHTVDFFVGLAEFKPTGIEVLDSATKQVAIHVEKTDYFSVSSHGTNDYTFLRYLNMRLVEVLQQDTILGEAEGEERTNSTSRTDRTDPAHYVQVTFTLGSQYTPMYPNTPNAEIIPLDSVRVGKGAFWTSQSTVSTTYHACKEYTTPAPDNTIFTQETADLFDSRFPWDDSDGELQTCGPQAQMCFNPQDILDQFVVFNIPLGIGWIPKPSNTLDRNVFVELVVTAEDKDAIDGVAGNNAEQMKTTLFSSIPVVQGGVNIFCDAITSKTDLQEVVDAVLVVGSAATPGEFERIRVFDNMASSTLGPKESQLVNSDSIESGLMTLVLLGEESYFVRDGDVGSGGYGVQLDDVITVHIMESDPDFDGDGTKSKAVNDLLQKPGEDNYDSMATDAELRTRGYNLNGAFRFTIDRSNGIAQLEPTLALLAVCPFNPSRPSQNDWLAATCVLRRDVRGRNTYPVRNGADDATAIEVAWAGQDTEENSLFMQSIMGSSDYAFDLGALFAGVLQTQYKLNGRYNRAYWINPGYEWTPTQTNGASKFSISQKLFMFALVSLDEEFSSRRAGGGAYLGTRRALLAGSTEDTGAGVSQSSIGFRTDPKMLVANALDIPLAQVTEWEVSMQLTRTQACMDRLDVRAELRATLERYFREAADQVSNVQIVYAIVDMGSETCVGVRRSGDDLSDATATFETLVAFDSASATINRKLLASQKGVLKVEATDLPDTFKEDDNFEPPPEEEEGAEESEGLFGLSSTVVYAIGGALGGLVLLCLAGLARKCLTKKKDYNPQEAEIVTVMNLRDIKAELQADMFGQGNSRSPSQDFPDLQQKKSSNGNVSGMF
eukprot:CAMPEP_0181303972 /NCGR_PEP_ID=MMETSP1101-20121128/8872_1 /TAXON_ID=46948 /ORGANISM="Rhodomonas abbreviata, Strain Caron Lab Isolate" /LENGTH=1212 /DNA_ID=CAMNT_0023409639 /DNA_START=371 /DNA_END=4009 /DNA_ORIENTATION=-